ncbi:hypothetical protein O3M35_003346 [Rhynocoris fuscipes]|uniref:Kazal-like domain-containing protein n=1 Tax=Rhynocoris fuscipes TaxID=488301 RepID=A0AAW1CK57_9HEMI
MENNEDKAEELETLNEDNVNKVNKEIDLDLKEYDTQCGIGGYKPKWLQKLASKKSYVLIYGLLGLYETSLASYYIGIISTIEKRFRFPSSISGLMTSTWDIGTLVASIVVAYHGTTAHKTKWCAFGITIAALSCFLRYLPHFIYGPGDTVNFVSSNSSSPIENLCNNINPKLENCSFNTEGAVAFTIIIISLLLLGVGTTPYYSLGAAYLDDNVSKNKFPFLFSWNPLGLIGLIISFFMALFPRMLPRELERRKTMKLTKVENNRSLKDFKETLMRLSKNKIFMYNSFSSTIGMLALIGFWIFMPKYIETQFRKTASEANLMTGTIGLVSTALGVISSGALISKFKPRPTYLAAWNVFTEAIIIITYLCFAYLGCYKNDLHGDYAEDKSWNLITECNSGCNCSQYINYSPVCSMDKTMTFYSACHAGCTNWYKENNTKIYENCSCIDGGLGSATDGPCPVQCQHDYVIFLALLCLMEFLMSTGRAGNTIIQYRAVNPNDKSVSIAITSTIFCLFSFIPGPIFYGMLLDLSCTVWGITCGKTGNCWLYDGQKMRYLMNFTAAGN